MRRNPSGDWDLPGGALTFVGVVLVLAIACEALGGPTYVDPAGWSLEVLDEVDRLEIAYYGTIGGPLEREMAESPGDCYLRGLLRTRERGLLFSSAFTFVAETPTGPVRAYRVLFVDGLKERCRRVFDTSKEPVLLTRVCFVRPERDNGDRAAPCVIQFPAAVRLRDIRSIGFERGGE